MEWLRQHVEVESALAGRVEQICRRHIAGHENDSAAGAESPDVDGGFNPGHGTHNNVADEAIGGATLGDSHRLLCAVGGDGNKPHLVKDRCEGGRDGTFIVNHEHNGRGSV